MFHTKTPKSAYDSFNKDKLVEEIVNTIAEIENSNSQKEARKQLNLKLKNFKKQLKEIERKDRREERFEQRSLW